MEIGARLFHGLGPDLVAGAVGGVALHGNRLVAVHRLVYRLVYGPVPAGHHVMHVCPIANRSCARPDHLRAGLPGENARAMVRAREARGEAPATALLTRDQVLAIRAAYGRGSVTQAKLATEYGVCRATIGSIVRGQSWTWLVAA